MSGLPYEICNLYEVIPRSVVSPIVIGIVATSPCPALTFASETGTTGAGEGVPYGVAVLVGVFVIVAVPVTVGVLVGVNVFVGVGDAVAVFVGVAVLVGVGEAVRVGAVQPAPGRNPMIWNA